MKTTTHIKRTVVRMIAALAMIAASVANSNPITEFPLPVKGSHPVGIVTGPDGNLWFTEFAGKIGRMRPNGSLAEFLTTGSGPARITVGPDHNLWFVEVASNQIGRVQTDGTMKEFGTRCTVTGYIASGPNNSVWFPETCA